MRRRPVPILLADDNDIDTEFFVCGFQKSEVEQPITIARDGIEALELMRGHNGQARLEQPYIIFADIDLPRMSGLELLQELRRDPRLTHSIVFILTSTTLESDMRATYDQQIAGYLLKAHVAANFSLLVRLVQCYQETIEFPP